MLTLPEVLQILEAKFTASVDVLTSSLHQHHLGPPELA